MLPRLWLCALALLLVAAAGLAAAGQPSELTDPNVQVATLAVAQAYGNVLPGLDANTLLWFLYAIEHRESTFHADHCNLDDGAASWNPAFPGAWPSSDGIPHGCGLTQLTGWDHGGMPYPNNARRPLSVLDLGIYGSVTPPRPVTALGNPLEPMQNLARFVTAHVLPMYEAIQARQPSLPPAAILRMVAFAWNKGDDTPYDPANCDYLCLYDTEAAQAQAVVAQGSVSITPRAPATAASQVGWSWPSTFSYT